MKALVIAGTNLRRLFRDRSNIFFVIILPMLLILLLGASFGSGFTPVIGIVGEDADALATELVATLEAEEDLEVSRYSNESDLVTGVNRGRVQAGLVIPAGYDETIRSGNEATLRFLSRPGSLGAQLRATVDAAIVEQSVVIRAARFVEGEGIASLDDAIEQAAEVASLVPGVEVVVTSAGEALFPEDVGTFDLGASSQLLLFVFLTSLTGSVALIETRRLGLARRMLATPTRVRTILLGEALGRIAVALIQGLIIMLGSALVFGVNWGDPLGAALILILFAMVGAGAGMLIGSVLNTDQQAGSIGLLFGLGLAAIGGSMVPLEVFPDTMRTISHFTPHAWGNDAFADLVRRSGTVADILVELAVLAAFAVVLLSVATWRLRKAITA